MKYLKIAAVSLGACWLACSAVPAVAQNSANYDQRAVNAYNQGLDAQESGHYASACQAFRDAAGLWENAIYGLMGESMVSEDARETIKAVADSLQANADNAKSHAQNVCGRPDDAPVYNDVPATPAAPEPEPESQFAGNLKEAVDFTELAQHQFEARNTAEGCVSARKARSYFVRVLTEEADNPPALQPMIDNIAIMDKWLANFDCAADTEVLTKFQKSKDAEAYATVAFHAGLAAKARGDFAAGCSEMKTAATDFAAARSWSTQAGAVDSNDQLDDTALADNDAAYAENIGKANALGKTYCATAALPFQEVVSVP